MKVQCPCGTKLSFDITPDAARQAIVVRCPVCNTDLSAVVAPFVQQALAEMSVPRAPAPVAAPRVHVQPTTPSVALPPTPVAAPVAPPIAAASIEVPGGPVCARHVGEIAQEKCRVCQKPICPRCMAQFGFVCSAFCQGKAENLGLDVPDYAGQRKNVNVRSNRLFKLSVAAAILLILALIGGWGLNEFYLSQPRVVFSVPLSKALTEPSGRWGDSGGFVVLHDGRLTRYALKTKQPVWTTDIVTSNEFSAAARAEAPRARAEYALWRAEQVKKPKQYDANGHEIWYDEVPSEEEQYQKLLGEMTRAAKLSLRLLGEGTNIWIAQQGKIARYRWEDGGRDKVIPVDVARWEGPETPRSLSSFTQLPNGDRKLVRVDLALGEVEEKLFPAPQVALASPSKPSTATPRKPASTGPGTASAGSNRKGPALTPVANARQQAQSQRLPPPGIAKGLTGPEAAIAAIQLQANTKLEAALNDDDELGPRRRHPELVDKSRVEYRMSGERLLKLTSILVEFKPVIRQAMKEPPRKSALDGAVSVTQTTQVANEILNESRRDQTDGVSVEDKSPYRVSLRHSGDPDTAGWSGEMVGSPDLIVLPGVNVLIADTALLVFDKDNKKLWETRLTYPMTQRAESWNLAAGDAESGGGPVIERGDTLYILDPGVVGAFDKSTGNARWRLPTVGASGLRFDSRGAVYINTTTMGQDQVRYDQQIDVSKKDRFVIIKAEASSGRILWRATNCGQIAAIIGDQLYTSEVLTSGMGVLRQEPVSHLLLYKLSPKTGKVQWEHSSRGAPSRLDIQGSKILVVRENSVDLFTHGAFN
ncbi:MAG: hypothetical protein HY299_04895 [Verrucomicrobia bacterium]|nr:hypothetical protein [Verrucomicrobiota bacterium]